MDRLTKKIENPQYSNDYDILCAHNYHAINKLGRLEDLMEKYKIEDIEMLEKIIIRHDMYNKLEEQLGCPLKVFFEALKNGFYDEYGNWYKADDFSLNYDWLLSNPNDKYLAFDVEYNYLEFKLTDYKNTWWLKADRSE